MSARELITEHLDLWTGAVTKKSSSGRGSNGKIELTGVKKLRALILQLAINGKLVEQNEHNETAKSLLSRVAESQAALIASGMLKKKKKLPPVTADDCYTVIPMGWEPVRLGDILDRISNGFGGKQTKTGSGLPLTRIETISDGTINPEKLGYSTEIPNEKQEYFKLQAGDILFSHINSDFHIGKTAIVPSNIEIYHGVNLLLLRPSELVSNKFIDIVINALRLDGYFLNIAQHAIGQASVNQSKVNNIAFALPPAEEQHHIVQKVDELMALCDRLEQQTSDQLEAHETLVDTLLGTLTQSENATELADNWARLAAHFDTLFTTEQSIDKLKQTILQLAVMGRLVEQDAGDEPFSSVLERIRSAENLAIKNGNLKKRKTLPELAADDTRFRLPPGWAWAKFDHIASPETSALKAGPFGSALKKSMYVSSGYKIYGQEQVIAGDEDVGDYFISEEKFKSLESCSVRPGDILISLVGTIGKVLILSENCQRGIINPRLVKLSLYKDINREYISLVLSSPLIQSELADKSHGGTMNILNLSLIRELSLPIPPVEEQHRIVQKVDELMALCDKLKERLNRAGETRCQLAEAVVENALN